MDMTQYEIEITAHAIMRSHQRGIDPDIICRIVRCGRRVDFGKDYAKWTSKRITCVGQIRGNRIKIFTVTIK